MSTRTLRIKVPNHPYSLMLSIYKKVLPAVHHQLSYWKRRAEQIPDPELRKQALASIQSKQFHCEGGAIYALLAHPDQFDKVISFIVAYQTISDYLDNLCDRSLSLDGHNFKHLHLAMLDAIMGNQSTENYYQYQEAQDDAGYLEDLVKTCQRSLQELVSIESYQFSMLTLCQFYCDLQVHKHIALEKREEALQHWFSLHQESFYQLEWYEFSAAAGSTLAIFYYAALASHPLSSEKLDHMVFEAYFPYVQGLHILLDYLIDQEEDRKGGDLNFCFYYPSVQEKLRRLDWFVKRAKDVVQQLPHAKFHHMMVEGLLGIYLADRKVKKQREVKELAKSLLKQNKGLSRFFFYNGWLVHRYGKKV